MTKSWGKTAIWTVPLVLALGIASGWLAGSGYGNPWFDALVKPGFMPPGWAFPVVWTTLYILMGISLAMLIAIEARAAIIAFLIQLALNLAWSPIFFALHSIEGALAVIVLLDAAVLTTVALAWRANRTAAILQIPYVAWLCVATALNAAILQLNT